MNKVSNKQSGVTLIELMISMSIGVVLVGIALQIMQSNRQAMNSTAEQGRMQENARFVQGYLKSYLTISGLTDYFSPAAAAVGQAVKSVVIQNCLGNNIPCSADGATDDVLTVSYAVPVSQAQAATGFTTCNGTIINAANIGIVRHVADSFTVVPGAVANTWDFQCQSYNLDTDTALGAPLILAGGIRGFQVLYGLFSMRVIPGVGGAPEQEVLNGVSFLNATQVIAEVGANNWTDVDLDERLQAIKFAFLASSEAGAGQTARITETYYILDAAPIQVVNGNMGTVVTTTTMLRNGG